MKQKGSDRLEVLSESQTLSLTKLVRKLTSEGRDIVGLTLGEPDFNTPTHIANAGIQAIRDGHTHYPPVAGIPELREAIAQKFNRENGLNYKAENIVVSTGAKQCLINAIMSLINPGDEVILIAPYWVSYLEMVKMAEGVPVILQTNVENGYKVSMEDLKEAISDKTRMLIVNSPNNPTGNMYSQADFEAMAKIVSDYPELIVLSDEIYEHLAFDEQHVSIGAIPGMLERTITVNGFSKGFAMTGWRMGYLGAPKWIADLCEKFQGQITSGANTMTQWASVEALNGGLDATFAMRDKFKERRDGMHAALSEIKGIKLSKPEGAFYLYPDLSNFLGKKAPDDTVIENIDQLTTYLIYEAGVAVIPGEAFGTDSHVRISYAYSVDKLKEGARRLREGLEKLS